MRERDGSDDKGRPIKRARAHTSALLPPQGHRQDTEEPPKPEDDLDKYDGKRLQQGLSTLTGRQNDFLIEDTSVLT